MGTTKSPLFFGKFDKAQKSHRIYDVLNRLEGSKVVQETLLCP